MASRIKEDEKNEKIIRGLLKLPANKRCINCNNLGPQYVCTNFWTFICTNCSGAHREFTHRVKSVSMAKFSAQEVSALQEGGNERAREVYFKEWDAQRNAYPDSSNFDRLRDFIRHVYVDRRYTGEKLADRPPRAKDDKEDESRRSELYRGGSGSRSPPYGESYSDRRSYSGSSPGYSYGERSPAYNQTDSRRSPRNFEVVDDRRRDDRNKAPVQRFEERRLPDARKPEGGSPNYQRDIDGSSPPVVRPVREILGDDAPPLRVGEPPKSNELPKANGAKAIAPPPQAQRSLSSSSTGSTDGPREKTSQVEKANSATKEVINTVSLIDFGADPEPPASGSPPPVQESSPQQAGAPAVNGGDWASFDAFNQQKAPPVTSNADTLDASLAQLSISELPSAGSASTLAAFADPTPKANEGGLLSAMQHSSPLTASVGNQSNQMQGPGELNKAGSLAAPSSVVGSTMGNPSKIPTRPPQETNFGVQTQPSSADSKTVGRKALPEDLFASLYPSAAPAMPGWQRAPQYGMGYAMQYPAGMTMQAYPQAMQAYPQAMQAYPQPQRPVNPFDLGGETASAQAPMFQSAAPMQGALSSMNGPPTLDRSSSFGVPSPRWAPPQQHPQQLYPSAAPPSQYMMQQQVPNSSMPQQFPNAMHPMMSQGALRPVNLGTPFVGNSVVNQHAAATYSPSSIPSSFGSVGGNPFG